MKGRNASLFIAKCLVILINFPKRELVLVFLKWEV